MFSDSTIVAPWDFSQHAQVTLNFLLEHVSAKDIRVICVLQRPDPYTFAAVWGEESETLAHDNSVEQFWGVIDKTKIPDLQFTAVFGDPATEIVRFAKSLDADMIVMSTHGRTGIKKLMLGSVANRVSQLASCAVLLLPNDWFKAELQAQSGVETATR
ncbi:universal stress protein [Saprospiraceae bacterium]|nr:universal stress protein [Saprospiraceae bacterium]